MGSTDGDSRRNAGNLRETGEHTLAAFEFRVETIVPFRSGTRRGARQVAQGQDWVVKHSSDQQGNSGGSV